MPRFQQTGAGDQLKQRQHLHGIRRIEEDDVVGPERFLRKGSTFDSTASACMPKPAWSMFRLTTSSDSRSVHEDHAFCAAAQGLDTMPLPGKEIEKDRPRYPVTKDIEEGLLHLVRRGLTFDPAGTLSFRPGYAPVMRMVYCFSMLPKKPIQVKAS